MSTSTAPAAARTQLWSTAFQVRSRSCTAAETAETAETETSLQCSTETAEGSGQECGMHKVGLFFPGCSGRPLGFTCTTGATTSMPVGKAGRSPPQSTSGTLNSVMSVSTSTAPGGKDRCAPNAVPMDAPAAPATAVVSTASSCSSSAAALASASIGALLRRTTSSPPALSTADCCDDIASDSSFSIASGIAQLSFMR
jgi:hypothetical protein